jgi:hypothetical protein
LTEIFKCRKIGESGAAQLLLDTYALKTALLEYPVMACGQPMPAAFNSYVVKEMGRAETIFKALSSGADEAGYAAFIESAAETPEQLDLCLSLRPTGGADEARQLAASKTAEQLKSAASAAFDLVDPEALQGKKSFLNKSIGEAFRSTGKSMDSFQKKFFGFGGSS